KGDKLLAFGGLGLLGLTSLALLVARIWVVRQGTGNVMSLFASVGLLLVCFVYAFFEFRNANSYRKEQYAALDDASSKKSDAEKQGTSYLSPSTIARIQREKESELAAQRLELEKREAAARQDAEDAAQGKSKQRVYSTDPWEAFRQQVV